jgi:hypothetical protein
MFRDIMVPPMSEATEVPSWRGRHHHSLTLRRFVMYVVQATFQAKPGKAQALVDRLAAAASPMADAGVKHQRVLIDHIADFWTVIYEATVEDLDAYLSYLKDPKVREIMGGYLDLVQSGQRRVYRIAAER